MVAPVTVSEKDLHTLLGIVSDHRDDIPAAGLPPSLLADLMGQIRCDVLSFDTLDSARQLIEFGQQIPPPDCDGGGARQRLRLYWRHYWDCDPFCYPDRSGDLRSVTMVSDFYSARQWHSTGMYCEYIRPVGMEHEMLLCLPAGHMRTVQLVLWRGPGPDFSERDRALLTLLRPHLHQAYLDAERHRHPTPQLTPRQRELLHHLAAGHTNAQIARRLGVSEGTVRIHLQNIYSKLQVSSRTAAVTRAFPDLAAMCD
jgi:DNA-binding CsgD family transcriptional regulator